MNNSMEDRNLHPTILFGTTGDLDWLAQSLSTTRL